MRVSPEVDASPTAAGHPRVDAGVRIDTASLSLRIDLDPGKRIGPGKIRLLELIATLGTITAAARAMNMSYRRAWLLVDELDTLFGRSVVERQTGGRHGGTARLTAVGQALVDRYRRLEQVVAEAAQSQLSALQTEIDSAPAQSKPGRSGIL